MDCDLCFYCSQTMCRAVVEKGNKSYGVEAKNADVTVISCTEQWGEFPMSQKTFFNVYKEPGMLMSSVYEFSARKIYVILCISLFVTYQMISECVLAGISLGKVPCIKKCCICI